MKRLTHDGKIGTDELFSPGYVWFRCSDYGLPCNTMGASGYHAVYRPMARGEYQGHEVVTDGMIADTREHYAIIRAEDTQKEKLENERFFAEIEAEHTAPRKKIPRPCPLCGTYCYEDCTASQY